MVTLNEKNNLKLKVAVYKDMMEPFLFVVDGNKRTQVNYGSGEMENDLNEFMINFDIVKNIDGAKELLDEITELTDNIGPHVRITLKESPTNNVKDLYNKVKA